MQRIKTVLDDLRCSSLPHQLAAADMLYLCLLFPKLSAADHYWRRRLGWQYWAASQRHAWQSAQRWWAWVGGASLSAGIQRRMVWSWHWEVLTDVGPFAGAELQLTALTFSAPPALRNNKFTCSHIVTIFCS